MTVAGWVTWASGFARKDAAGEWRFGSARPAAEHNIGKMKTDSVIPFYTSMAYTQENRI